jgi:hypothetical protein
MRIKKKRLMALFLFGGVAPFSLYGLGIYQLVISTNTSLRFIHGGVHGALYPA